MAPFRRRVQNVSHCKPGERHCSGAREYNVFSRADSATEVFPVQPEATETPTSSPTSAPTKALPDCDSLLENDSVVTDGQQRLEVTYLYQVQTTIDQSVESLHDTVLGQLENELNSLLLKSWLNGVLCRSRDLPSVVISEDRLQQETSALTNEDMIVTDISTTPKDLVRPGLDGGTLEEITVGMHSFLIARLDLPVVLYAFLIPTSPLFQYDAVRPLWREHAVASLSVGAIRL